MTVRPMGGVYRLSGLTIESPQVSLARYANLEASASAGQIQLLISHEPAPPCEMHHAVVVDGAKVMDFGRAGDRFALRTDELATFILSEGASEVVCHPDAGCEARHIASMFVDRVIPYLIDARGMLAIHASAVAFDDGAVAFLGATGAGKSSLSAALCPPARYLCDDCAVIALSPEPTVFPSYAFARLHQDAARALGATDDLDVPPTRSTKWTAQRRGAPDRAPLRAIYILDRGPVDVTPIGARDAIVQLAKQLFRVAPTDRQRLAAELDRLQALADRVPVKQLRYPHRFDVFDEVRSAIAADLTA